MHSAQELFNTLEEHAEELREIGAADDSEVSNTLDEFLTVNRRELDNLITATEDVRRKLEAYRKLHPWRSDETSAAYVRLRNHAENMRYGAEAL